MKTRHFIHLAVMILAVTPAFAAGKGGATVTEAVNQVDHGASASSDTQPAKVGTSLQDGEYLKTGVKSRAELELANQSITRLGANTIFNYSAANNEIDLQAGTVLFSKPKDGQPMQIKTAAVTAAIVGTTGFIQRHGKSVIFGLVEGHATMTVDGITYTIHAGEILRFTPGQPPQIFAFNVPLFLSTSPLITKFHHHLPNQRYIDQEIADYNDDVERGFIQPPTEPFFLTSFEGTVPTVPIPGFDSAGNALSLANTPPVETFEVQNNSCSKPRCRPPCGGGNQVSFVKNRGGSGDIAGGVTLSVVGGGTGVLDGGYSGATLTTGGRNSGGTLTIGNNISTINSGGNSGGGSISLGGGGSSGSLTLGSGSPTLSGGGSFISNGGGNGSTLTLGAIPSIKPAGKG